MPDNSSLFTAPLSRLLACVLGVLVTAVVTSSGATLYLPFSEIDRIGAPAVVFPFVWVALLCFCTVVRRIWIVWSTLVALTLLHVALIYLHLSGS
tara:strand:+ start:3442 stop:3726 length:285 start_codon:yes stop_codon:yes gene_type:complete